MLPLSPARLHLIVGDGLMSQFGQWLKLGVTALVVRAAERDPSIGNAVHFADPAASIKAFVADAALRLAARGPDAGVRSETLPRGRDAHASSAARFPPGAREVTQAWADVLETMAVDPRALSDRLDPLY